MSPQRGQAPVRGFGWFDSGSPPWSEGGGGQTLGFSRGGGARMVEDRRAAKESGKFVHKTEPFPEPPGPIAGRVGKSR